MKNIEDEKNKILSSISDLKTKSRSIENELSKNIKQVFEKSKANGISTLSDVALFQSFLFPSIDYFKNNNENKITNIFDKFGYKYEINGQDIVGLNPEIYKNLSLICSDEYLI